MLLGDKLFELPRTDRLACHTHSSSSSLRTQGPIATGGRDKARRLSDLPKQYPPVIMGPCVRMRSQGRRRGLRMMAIPTNHILL